MDYRREIDGLRALAVLPVILFHAGLETFSGGFVGVDVFFVISGYLITSIILAGRQAGTFSLAGFYERRARRILPALFFVLFACLPAAWLLLLPADLELFSRALVAVTFFGSNFLFHATSGYFEAAAEMNPLLHTWSLAVEEQYYLLFPLFLLVAWRLGTRGIVTLLVLATATSFAMADWGSTRHPSFTFYMLPTRGWELLAGALAAFYLAGAPARANPAGPVAQVLAVAGVALIAFAVLAFDRETPFPGRYALVPVIGTLLVILFARAQTLAGKCLGSPLLVGIGLVSYSAYLWHQPLFAFARHQHPDALPAGWTLALLGATFLLAWMSWRFVESPFRDSRRTSRRTIVLFGTASAAVLVAAGLAGHIGKGIDSRLSDTQRAVAAWAHYDFADAYRAGRCFLQPGDPPGFAAECAGTPGTPPALLLWGDSYAAALSAGLRARDPGLAQYTSSGCPPVLEATIARRKNCVAINARILAAVHELQPRDIVLHANWHSYEREGALGKLPATLARIRAAAPGARITLVGGVPQWSPTLPILLVRRNVGLNGEQSLPMPMYERIVRVDATIAGIASAQGASFVSALAILCDEDRCRAVIASGDGFAPTAWDKGHLTGPGSRYLADRLGPGR